MDSRAATASSLWKKSLRCLPQTARERFSNFPILLVFFCLALLAHAEVIDRLAITVGRQVITELQLDEELRVTALLNQKPVDRSISARRAAANRLIEQLLVRREMELSRYPLPEPKDVDTYLQKVEEQLGGPSQFEQLLSRYDLSEDTLKAHLALQLITLRFVEYRFKPEAVVSEADISAYYQRELSVWSTQHTGLPPALSQVKESIRQTLTEERTDQALDAWLNEARRQARIVYVDATLR
ncbi:MAG TPA: hypothetical protein VFB14_00700 [Bryobacteraceae bacterium]|jgi:hypothetical protein|nr:hypothetical protein [Bryobacteraceae bacterium]